MQQRQDRHAEREMPGTEIVRKQSVLGGAAGMALLAFALLWRFYPSTRGPEPQNTPPVATMPASPTPLAPLPYTQPEPKPAPPPSPPIAETPPAPPAPPPPKEIAALLKKADKALAADKLIEPKDASALALYSQVLAADKDNAAAKSGIEKIRHALLQQTNAALDRGDEKESERLIAAFAQLPNADADLATLATRAKTLKQVRPMLSHAVDLLKQGHATEPARDNALAVYREVIKLDPANKLADAGLAQIERTYLVRALDAAAQDDFDGADKVLADASSIRPGSHELLDTRTRIEGIRRERATNTLAQANSALDAGNAELAQLLEQKALGLSPDLSVDEFNRRLRNARLYASFSPGQVINDKFLDRHGAAPPVVVVPTGAFTMGSPASEEGHRPSEEPQREVKISSGFAIGRTEVRIGEFREFINDTGYSTDAEKAGTSSVYDEDSGRIADKKGVTWRDDYLGEKASDDLPVIHVSWNDASAYALWLAARTGKRYRLPSEAEFEYALRAGSALRYPWGDGNPAHVVENVTGDADVSPHQGRKWAKAFHRYSDGYWGPAPVGKFRPNAFGLFDMDGNVSAWVEDCWHDNYTRAPADSRAWINPGCATHVVRGGSWGSAPDQVRSAYRLAAPSDARSARVGIRVARDL